jgi:thiol-disulfide isomerase/thioredoxin
MFRLLSMTAIVCAATFCGGSGTEVTWRTDYLDALKVAKAEKKVVLVDFTGSDWCGWCKKLQAEVFTQPEFQTWAAQKAVLLEIDFPRQKELSEGLRKQNAELQEKVRHPGLSDDRLPRRRRQRGWSHRLRERWTAAWIKAAESAIQVPSATTWSESWDDAVKRAKAEKKPILADFTGSDWCIWCQRLDKEVFDQAEFSKWGCREGRPPEARFPAQARAGREAEEAERRADEEVRHQRLPDRAVPRRGGEEAR